MNEEQKAALWKKEANERRGQLDGCVKTIYDQPWPWGYLRLLGGFDWERAHNTHLFGILIPILMSTHDIKTVIEIGIDRAWVTHVAAKSLMAIHGGGVLYSCDIKPECCAMSREQTEGMLITHDVLCRDSTKLKWADLCPAENVKKPILCVIDGDHNIEPVLCDFRLCDEVMVEGSFVLAHDFHAGVRKEVELFMSESGNKWSCIVIEDNSPTAIMKKEGPK